jgi:hypothetical protein
MMERNNSSPTSTADTGIQRENPSERPCVPPSTLPPGEVASDPSVPFVEAELVTPPVQAFLVSIDEDPSRYLHSGVCSSLEVDQHPCDDASYLHQCPFLSAHKLRYSLFVALGMIGVLCAIAIPVVILKRERKFGETVQGGMGATTHSPTPSYPCYTSTADILRAQLSDDVPPEAYIICPDTAFSIGVLKDPANNNFSIVDGDYPLVAVRENVTIQCGIDGRRENNCVLNGGQIHVLTSQQLPSPDDGSWLYIETPVHNFTIRGITFTGRLINDGVSVLLSHPAKNVLFQDCLWVNLTSAFGLIAVLRNWYQQVMDLPLEGHTIHATFSDCVFDGFVYDYPIIQVANQSVAFVRTIFNNISVSLVDSNCQFQDLIAGRYEGGCAALLFCGPGCWCTMNDICVIDFEFEGPSLLQICDTSDFQYDGLFSNMVPTDMCELSTITADGHSLQGSNCTGDVFTLASCPLRLPLPSST